MQQINLYTPELRPKREWLTASTVLMTAVGLVCLLSFAFWSTANSVEDYSQTVALIESQINAVESRVERFKKMPRNIDAVQIERKLQRLKKSIEARQAVGKIIQGQNLGNEQGFSSNMRAFARQSSTSVSLERIKISRGGKFIELAGVTRTVKDVPAYLQRLKKESSLAQSNFGLLTLVETNFGAASHRFSFGFEALYPSATLAESR